MDTVEEKANTLSRCGSFYYGCLNDTHKKEAEKLSHLIYNCRAIQQLKNACNATLSGGYFDDHFKVIRFNDTNIIYFGAYSAYQKREVGKVGNIVGTGRPEFLRWANVFFGYFNTSLEDILYEEAQDLPLLSEKNGGPLQAEEYEPGESAAIGSKEFYNTVETSGNTLPVLFPSTTEGGTLNQVASSPIFGLTVGDDILVHTILLNDGRELKRGVDFNSYYGLIILKANPAVMFSEMKLMASSYTYRRRNLLCYTLSTDYVCGPVARIMDYYREVQSPKAFYLAAAQACGMAVIRESTYVDKVLKMYKGFSYIMANGDRYDVDYPHTTLVAGDTVSEGQVIGSDKLFSVILPGDDSVADLESIKLKRSVPVPGLIAMNTSGALFDNTGLFQPTLSYDTEEGSSDGPDVYRAYVRALGTRIEGAPSTGNVMMYFLNNILGNKYIIIRLNKSIMPKEMLMRLNTFIDREAPIGSVLLEASL